MLMTKSNIPHTSTNNVLWVIVQSLVDFISKIHESIDSARLELKLLPSQSRSTWLFSISQPMVFYWDRRRQPNAKVQMRTLWGEREKESSYSSLSLVFGMQLSVNVNYCQLQDVDLGSERSLALCEPDNGRRRIQVLYKLVKVLLQPCYQYFITKSIKSKSFLLFGSWNVI